MSKTVALEEFASHLLEVLEQVAATHEELLVTKDGQPIVRIVPGPATLL